MISARSVVIVAGINELLRDNIAQCKISLFKYILKQLFIRLNVGG